MKIYWPLLCELSVSDCHCGSGLFASSHGYGLQHLVKTEGRTAALTRGNGLWCTWLNFKPFLILCFIYSVFGFFFKCWELPEQVPTGGREGGSTWQQIISIYTFMFKVRKLIYRIITNLILFLKMTVDNVFIQFEPLIYCHFYFGFYLHLDGAARLWPVDLFLYKASPLMFTAIRSAILCYLTDILFWEAVTVCISPPKLGGG